MHAAANDDLEAMRLILSHKINIGCSDNLGNHLYHHCVSSEGCALVINYIMSYKDFIVRDRHTMVANLLNPIEER